MNLTSLTSKHLYFAQSQNSSVIEIDGDKSTRMNFSMLRVTSSPNWPEKKLTGHMYNLPSRSWSTINIYRPANKVCESYVFTGVCLSTGGGGRLCPKGVCSRGSLSKGFSVQGGSLSRGWSLSRRGSLSRWSLSRWSLSRESLFHFLHYKIL